MRVTHVRLLTLDLGAALRFYRDVVGLEVSLGTEDGGYAELDAGGVVLALFPRDEQADAVGTSHLPAATTAQDPVALILEVEEFDELLERLRASGAWTAGPTEHPEWGLATLHFRDPDGTLVEAAHDLPRERWSAELQADLARNG